MAFIVKTTGIDNWLGPDGTFNIKVLLMGEHGSGKTPTAATWPKPFFLACEPGMASLAHRSIPYADIKSAADMEAALDFMRRNCTAPPAQRKYLTLVIDTIDSYQRTIIQERLRDERKDSLSGWADWGWLDAKMNQLIERLNNLPMNVVVLMHTKDSSDLDGDDSVLVKKARLKGDVKDTIFQDFDLIGQVEKSYVSENGERVLKRHIRWHAEPKYPTLRDRFNVLPKFTDVDFTERDYQQIFDALTAKIDDIPESQVLDSIETEQEDPAPADVQGGPVEQPELPPAKKAAAKKTARKTAAKAAPAEGKATAEIENPERPAEDQEEPVAALDNVEEYTAADVAAELGAEVIEETAPEEPAAEPVAAEPVAEPEPQPKPKSTAAKSARYCGEQPPSHTHFPAAPGCGQQLTAQNAQRFQSALLKHKTYLCDDCLEKNNQRIQGV